MHNWRLLILLIPSLLQPILSEHSFINGRQYCIHSSRSLSDERFLHEKHRFGKPISSGERLVDQRPTEQFGIRRYRYDVRDVEPIRFSSESPLERRILASDDRKPVVHVREQRTIKDVSTDVQRKIDREKIYKNFRNGRNSATSLYARLPEENRVRESRVHSEHRYDTRQDKRRSDIRHSRQEVSRRIVKSNTDRKSYVLRQNFRNENTLNRQDHRYLNLQAENVLRESTNIADSLEQNIRKRSLDRDSTRDIARSDTPIINLRRERVYNEIIEHNIRQNDNDRARSRNIVRIQNRVNSHIRNNLEYERYSKARSRKWVSASTPDNSRQSGVRQLIDRQIVADSGRFDTSSLKRENRQGRYIVLDHQKSKTVLRIDPSEERNNERRINICERTVSVEHFVSQSERNKVEELNRNKRDLRTDTRNDKMYLRNGIRDRIHFEVRDINTDNANNREERTNLRSKRTEIRNAERYARDNVRDETYYSEIRQYRTEIITGNRRTPSREEPNNNAKNERANNRNSERYSRDTNSRRSISVNREVSKIDSRVVLDLSIAQSRNERHTNARVERIHTRNDKRYSREQILDSDISNEHNVRQTESKRVLDVRSREARTREERNAIEGTHIRNIIRNSEKHSRNVQDVRTDMRNGERYSRGEDFDERGILRSDVRRITNENNAEKLNERNIRVRLERIDARFTERYGKGKTRERISSINRDVRQHEMERNTDRHLTSSRNERNMEYDRTDVRYSEDNTGDRSVSVDQEGRRLNVKRVANLRSRDERNIYVRNARSNIINEERYSRYASRERVMFVERNDEGRQVLTMRIKNRQMTRGNGEHNLNVRKERSDIRYIKDDRIRDQTPPLNDRDLREINSHRILRNQIAMNDDKRSYLRFREQKFRDFTHERTPVSVERDTTVENRNLQGLGRFTSNERRMRDQNRDRDSLTTSPRLTRSHRLSRDEIRNRDYVRASDAHVSESRKATAMRSSTSDLYRERETDIRVGYRGSRNIDMRRDYISRDSVFTNGLRIMARTVPTSSAIAPTENHFNTLFYGQYFFYAIQGIYILGVLIQVFKEKKNSKTSSMGWFIPTRLVKVD